MASFVVLSYLHQAAGNLDRALHHLDEGLAVSDDPDLGRGLMGFSPYLWLRMYRGGLLVMMGRPHEALRHLDDTLALAREVGDLEMEGWCHMQPVARAWVTGEPAGALEHARASVEIAERLSSPFSLTSSYLALGTAQLMHERWDDALAACKRGLEVAAESPSGGRAEPGLWRCAAEAELGKGDREAAVGSASRAVDTARARGTRLLEGDALLTLGRVLLRSSPDDLEEAETALQDALGLVQHTGARSREPFVRLELAELARAREDHASRERELAEARRLFGEMGCDTRVAEVDRLLAEVH